jgi:hypothetical protein
MKIVVTILVLFLSYGLFGQTKPESVKKFYKDKDGKLYVNKALPLFLHISDSKDEKGNHFVMESQSSPEYSTPFFLDTEGWNTIRTPSKVDPVTRKPILPKSDVIFEIYADGLPPTTKIVYKVAQLFDGGGKLFMGKGLEISLESTDAVSGVDQIYFSVNDAAYEKYSKPLTFNKEMEYNLKSFAVDNVGNQEDDVSLKFIPDYSTPVSKMELKTDFRGNVISPRSTFTISSSDNLSGLKLLLFNFDEGKTYYYTTILNPSFLSEGEHTLGYYGQDNVGNVEDEKKFTFFMDKTAPEVNFELVGDDYISGETRYVSSRTKVKLTATDNKAGVKQIFYSINGKEPSVYHEPFPLDVKAVAVNLRYYAVDSVENSGKDEAYTGVPKFNLNIVRDEDRPQIVLNYTAPNIIVNKMLYLSTTSMISINATDALSGVKKVYYKVDNQESVYDKTFTVNGEGRHKIVYRAIDNANNEAVESIDFYVDNTGPDVNIQFGIGSVGVDSLKKVDVYPPRTAIFITATDQLVGYDKIMYSLNGAPELESKGVIKEIPVGEYNLKVRAFDKLGNVTAKEANFIIRKNL